MSFNWVGKSEDGETVVLRKFKDEFSSPSYFTSEWQDQNAALIRSGLVLDLETTGLDRSSDQVIEIGLQPFKFNRLNGDILEMGVPYSALQDPGQPLSETIQSLTGLTDEQLKGQSIDWPRVNELMTEAQIIIAHNASFDRPFMDRLVPISSSKIWGCSLKQIDWKSKGYPSRKLEILSIYHGFFVDAHRALNDVKALLHLLSFTDHLSGKTYLNELISNARRPLVKVVANHSPFEAKDQLKARSYSWNAKGKFWYGLVYKDLLDAEVAWLKTSVYGGEFPGTTIEIPVSDNFKSTS